MKEKIKVGVVVLGRRGDIIVQHCLAKMADVDVVKKQQNILIMKAKKGQSLQLIMMIL